MFGTVRGLELKSQHRLFRQSDSRDAPSTSHRYGHKELTPLPRSHSQGQICTLHQLTILTKHACYHNSCWGSKCDSNHAPTISLKPVHIHGDFGIPFRRTTQVLPRHTSSLTSDHSRYLELFRTYFLQNLHILANLYQNKPFQASNTEYSKSKPERPDVFDYANYDTQGIKFQR